MIESNAKDIDSTKLNLNFGNDLIKNIDKINANSFETTLQGKFASLFIQNVSGSPGSQQIMAIRNSGLAAAGNYPLIILNGIPIFAEASQITGINPLSTLNIDDIEQIEVIKDASALAIFGSRGANGVLVIKTKTADDASKVNVNLGGGLSLIGKKVYKDVIGGQLEVDRLKKLYDNRNLLYPNDQTDYPLFVSNPDNSFFKTNNWQKDLYEIKDYMDANIGISGMGVFGYYNITLGYHSNEGIIKGSKLNRFNLGINSRYNISEKFGFDFFINGIQLKKDESNNILPPAYAPFNNNPIFPENIFIVDNSFTDENINNHIYSNAKIFFNESNNFEISTSLGLVYENYRNDFFSPSTLNNGNIISSSGSGQSQRFISRTEIEKNNLLNKQKLSVKIGFEAIFSLVEDIGITGNKYGTVFSDFVKVVMGFSRNELDGRTSMNKYNLLSGYSLFNYYLFDKFELTGSLRADAASQFSKKKRLIFFPGLGFNWRLFENENKTIQKFLLKGGGSLVGINNEASYFYGGSMISIGNYGSVEAPVTYYEPNDNLSYPISKIFDFGIDVTLKNNIWFNIDYFHKENSNIIILKETPQYSGYKFKRINGLDSKIDGLEFTIGWNKKIGNISWNSNIVSASIGSKITKIDNETDGILPGNSLSAIYAYRASGKFEEININTKTGNLQNFEGVPFQIGLPKILDRNNDQFITHSDTEAIANSNPAFFGGWYNNLTYKNIYLETQFSFAGGTEIVTESRVERYSKDSYLNAQLKDNGKLTPFYFITKNSTDNITIQGISSIDKISYLRLNNITLGYLLNSKFLGSRDLNIYSTAFNIFTLSNYKGSNPEENLIGISQFDLGTSGTPLSTTIVLGLKVKF